MLSRRAFIAQLTAFGGIGVARGRASAASSIDPFLVNEYPSQPIGYKNAAGKVQVTSVISAPSTTKTVIVGGQSNMATACGTATYTTVSSSANNLSIYDGGIYAGSDPVLGASYAPATGLSSVPMRIADRAIAQGKATRAIMVPVAIGGTPYAAWVPTASNTLFTRVSTAILRCRARGLEPDVFVWGQGETDNGLGTSAASVTASIQAIVGAIRAAPISCTAPFYVGLYTMVSGSSSATIRTGISNSVSAPLNIVLGYDADTNCTVAGGFRLADQTHLSNTGLTLSGNGWADLVFP